MTVSDLFGYLDPAWKVRNIMPIRDEPKSTRGASYRRSKRERACETVNRYAGAWASTLRNPSSVIEQLANCDELFARSQRATLGMKFVINEPESDQGIYVE